MINTINYFITSLTVLVLIIHIYLINKQLNELKNDIREVKRNYVSRIEKRAFDSGVWENKELIEELAASLDKKVEPTEDIEHYSYLNGQEESIRVIGYKVVDLTDEEKRARELRQEADELEREEK